MITRILNWGGVGLLAFTLARSSPSAAYLDWDVIVSIVLGLAAVGAAILDYRRTSRLDELAVQHAERLSALEAVAVYATNVDKRLDALDYNVARLEERRESVDVLQLVDRVAATESVLGDVRERVAVVEARADHKPITQTRRKDGKFAPPDSAEELSTKESPK